MNRLKGLVAATYTPFDQKGNLKLDLIGNYVEYLIRSGMTAIYACGTTGEGFSMTIDERKAVMETYVQAVAGRIPVIAQVGANSLGDCCELAAHAESVGVTHISANAPSYFRIENSKILADYMTEIASAAPKSPFYYYHIPRFTGVSLDMTVFLSFMENQCPQFAGVKYTDLAAFVFQEAVEYGNRKYDILWGCDEMLLSALVIGARGGVGSTYTLIPEVYRNLMAAWEANDLASAQQYQLQSWMFVKTLLRHGHIIATQKAVMKMIGFDFGPSRLPITPLDSSTETQLRKELTELGFVK